MAKQISKFGKVEIIWDDSGTPDIVQIKINGTIRLVVNDTTGDVTIGDTQGAPDNNLLAKLLYAETGANIGSLSSGAGILNVTGLSAMDGALEVSGTSSYIKCPVLTTTQRDALTPSVGMVIYNSTTKKHEGYTADAGVGSPGWIAMY